MYSKDTSATIDRTPRRFSKPVAERLPSLILWLIVLVGVAPGFTGCDAQNVVDSLLARNTWAMLHPLTITSVIPPSGSTAGGTEVTIRGTGFDSGVGVLFGEHAALSVEFVNEGLMRATTPPQDAGQVPIILLSPYGQAMATGASFAYLEPASPLVVPLSITSVTPPSGSTAGGTDVTIRGTGFDSSVGVLFGEHAALSVEVVNEGLLRATTPPQGAGQVPIVLLSPYGQAVETGASFAFLEPASPLVVPLSITSITPNSGPTSGETIVTIRGTGFVDGLAVTFDGLAAPQVQITNSELLTAVSPPHTEAIISLTLVAPDLRSATLAGAFEYALDADGDGVADVDTDGDGMSDQKELEGWDVWVDYYGVGMGTDTFGNTAGLYPVTSNPNNSDTDGDGLNDYRELQLRTDPRSRDTDNDGLYDPDDSDFSGRVDWTFGGAGSPEAEVQLVVI